MFDLIVESADLVALVGGAEVDRQTLNILQRLTDIFVAADGGANGQVYIGKEKRIRGICGVCRYGNTCLCMSRLKHHK